MTLFSTIHLSNNALIAAQLGLQVASNNIANANTPGYIRERLVLTPSLPQRYGNLILGLGVDVEAVVQVADRYLQERLRTAESDVASGEMQASVYAQLEALIGELADTDISTALTDFFASVHEILNQPESVSVRNLAVLQGRSLTDHFRRLYDDVQQVRKDVDSRVVAAADDINRLLAEIADLNEQIVVAEGSDTSPSDALGLRDRRGVALSELAKLINIRTAEQPAGDVAVYSEGDFLVFANQWREVALTTRTDRGLTVHEVHVAETDAPVATISGKLAGLYAARDQILGGTLDDLDELARTLMFEFNRIYSGGQGLVGHSSQSAEFAVDDVAVALTQAGLEFTPDSGVFEVHVVNTQTGLRETTDIQIDLNGLGAETTLTDLAAALDAIDGITATIDADRRLQITSDSPAIEFAFGDDTSGVLAALGINTFFTGSHAYDVGVSQTVRDEPAKFAASLNGIGEDTEVAALLANLLTAPLASQGGATLATIYDRMTSEVAQGAADTNSATEGFRIFQRTLEAQHLGISGVNLDEEAVRMITFQKMFQASARVIETINEMIDILVNL